MRRTMRDACYVARCSNDNIANFACSCIAQDNSMVEHTDTQQVSLIKEERLNTVFNVDLVKKLECITRPYDE